MTDPEQPPMYTERTNMTSRRGDTPPSYTEAQGPPPSYESLYGRVKQARVESESTMGFMKAFFVIIISTVGFTIILALLMAIPVAMIVMGALHLDDCPAEKMIPIYLVVAGCFGVVSNLISLVTRCRKNKEAMGEQIKAHPCERLINSFITVWFIAGCVYIYRTKGHFQSHDKTQPEYCDYELYWFAFWVTTAVYIIFALFCCCISFCGCVVTCFEKILD